MVPVYQGGNVSNTQSAGTLVTQGVAASIGILAALLIDFAQKGDNSAFVTATQLLNNLAARTLNWNAAPPYVYAVALIIAGFVLVFVMQPGSTRNAFIAGIGALSFLATLAPVSDLTQALPEVSSSSSPSTPAPATSGFSTGTNGMNFAAEPSSFPVVPRDQNAAIRAAAAVYPVRVAVQFPNLSIPPMSVKLHDYISGQTFRLAAGRSRDGRVVIDTAVTGGSPQGTTLAKLEVRVEAPGYAITTASAEITTATSGTTEIDLSPAPSRTPLWLQRTQYPYKW